MPSKHTQSMGQNVHFSCPTSGTSNSCKAFENGKESLVNSGKRLSGPRSGRGPEVELQNVPPNVNVKGECMINALRSAQVPWLRGGMTNPQRFFTNVTNLDRLWNDYYYYHRIEDLHQDFPDIGIIELHTILEGLSILPSLPHLCAALIAYDDVPSRKPCVDKVLRVEINELSPAAKWTMFYIIMLYVPHVEEIVSEKVYHMSLKDVAFNQSFSTFEPSDGLQKSCLGITPESDEALVSIKNVGTNEDFTTGQGQEVDRGIALGESPEADAILEADTKHHANKGIASDEDLGKEKSFEACHVHVSDEDEIENVSEGVDDDPLDEDYHQATPSNHQRSSKRCFVEMSRDNSDGSECDSNSNARMIPFRKENSIEKSRRRRSAKPKARVIVKSTSISSTPPPTQHAIPAGGNPASSLTHPLVIGPTTSSTGGSWSDYESFRLYEAMRDLHHDETDAGIPHLRDKKLFDELSRRITRYGISRTGNACKNYWSRYGRVRWNLNERDPTRVRNQSLSTSQQTSRNKK